MCIHIYIYILYRHMVHPPSQLGSGHRRRGLRHSLQDIGTAPSRWTTVEPEFWLVIWMGFETSTESPNFGNVCHDTEQTSTGNNLVIRVELKIDSPVRRELSSFPPQTCEAKELEIEVPTYGPKDFPRTKNEKKCVSIGA